MKKHIAFIGSSVADVIIRIPHLPVRQEDINIESQTLSLGGCAFNAAWMCRLLGSDPLFFSPVGTGIYGDFVRRQLQERRIDILLESKEENGCCYCLVESDGERTFLSHHGAEYRFQKEWFSLLDSYGVDTIYVCGLELEEKTGVYILDYLQKHPQLTIYFAPGPRLSALSQGCIETLFNLHCILHLMLHPHRKSQHRDCFGIRQPDKGVGNITVRYDTAECSQSNHQNRTKQPAMYPIFRCINERSIATGK